MALTASQLAVVSRLLDEALPLDDAARGRWLASLPKEHETLRPALQELLRHATSVDAADASADPLWQLERQLRTEAKIHHVGELVGPYRLVSERTRSALASTWIAESTDIGHRTVELKLPHADVIDAGLGQRIVRERARLAALGHPSLSRLYDTGWTEGGQPFIAVEHVDGTALDQWCREKRLDVRDRVRLFLDTVRAVANIHAHGVVHRDIQPATVVVTDAGKIKLLDVGLVKILSSNPTGVAGADPKHAAPEQIRGEPASFSTDIYALGVVLYELLGGRAPYVLMTREGRELEDAILHQDPPGPSRITKDPRAAAAMRGPLDAIVLKALAKEPAQRYETAAAFAADLDRYLSSQGAEAQRGDGDGFAGLGSMVRNPAMWVGVAIAVVVVAVGFLVW